MSKPAVAIFVMAQDGHFRGLLPLISGIAAREVTVYVLTDRRFKEHVEQAGASFIDLFERHPLADADARSHPHPCRFVTFAGVYTDEVLRDLEEVAPSLVIYDTHAVIGRVVAASLGIPYVNACAGHNVSPARVPELLATLPRVEISASCYGAALALQERFGIDDPSPFAFLSASSPFLNVYGEPSNFLTDDEQQAFTPVAFHGSLPSPDQIEMSGRDGPSYFNATERGLKVYVSFGTVVWRYWPTEALEAMRSISASLSAMSNTRAVLSLGDADIGAETKSELSKPNVAIADWVDQWRILEEADVFVTHHGLGSTHEAIFNAVPMISYPFIWDQPALARKCQRLGLAIPLTESPRDPVRAGDVERALADLRERRASLQTSLAEARKWELQTIEGRDAVLDRVLDLIGR